MVHHAVTALTSNSRQPLVYYLFLYRFVCCGYFIWKALYKIRFLTCIFFHLSWCFKFFYVVACANSYTFLLIRFNCMNMLHFVFIHWWKFLLSFFIIMNNISMNITYVFCIMCFHFSQLYEKLPIIFPKVTVLICISTSSVWGSNLHFSLSDFLSVHILVGRNNKLFWFKLFFPSKASYHAYFIFIILISLLKYCLWLNRLFIFSLLHNKI